MKNLPTPPTSTYNPLHPPTSPYKKNKKKHKNMKLNYKLNIAAALKQRNITKRSLAQRLNVKEPAVTAFINGNPTINTLYAIAEALDCEVIDLFFPTEEAPALSSEEEAPALLSEEEDPALAPTHDLHPPTSPTPTSSSPSNEPPFSAISSPSHTPTLAISCPHCHRPLFLSFCATPTLE